MSEDYAVSHIRKSFQAIQTGTRMFWIHQFLSSVSHMPNSSVGPLVLNSQRTGYGVVNHAGAVSTVNFVSMWEI